MVELLVVLTIMGLVVSMSVPAMTRYAHRARLKTSVRQMVGLLSLARSLAISSHEKYAVSVSENGSEFQIVNMASGEPTEHVLRIPSSVSVAVEVGGEESADAQVVFEPTGSLSGRTTSFVLSAEGGERTITVAGATGAIVIER